MPNTPFTLGGVEFRVGLTPVEIGVMQAIVRAHRPQRIVELGTWRAGAVAVMRGELPDVEIVSFDGTPPQLSPRQWDVLGRDDTMLLEADCHNQPWLITSEMSGHARTFLFCDAGIKGLLVQQYCRWLKVGDLIGVHDWGRHGLHWDAVAPALLGFEPFGDAPSSCELRFWIRDRVEPLK